MTRSNLSDELRVLQAIMVRTRALAYETGHDAEIADIMDNAEYMAAVLLETPPKFEIFRAHAIHLARRYPHLFSNLRNVYNDVAVLSEAA